MRLHADVMGLGPRSVRPEVPVAYRSRPPSFARWPAPAARSIALGLASVFGLSGCGGDLQSREDGQVYFAESDQSYEIRSLGAHLDQFDERVSFGSLADILVTPAGYFVADGLNHHIVLLDRSLNPVRVSGRDGDGPGEYRFPSRMDYAGDQILVVDVGTGRASYLTQGGDFVTSQLMPGNASDAAFHPDLGLLVAGDAFRDHYLARVTAGGGTPFGPIPDELRLDPKGPFQPSVDLVTVSRDGLIHVLDGDQLALVSFGSDGGLVSTVFLPKDMRARELTRNAAAIEAWGGPERVLSSQIVASLRPLGDGRLFARITSDNTLGLILDLTDRVATRLVFPAEREDWSWMRASGVYLDGMDRLVLTEGLKAAGLLTAKIELTDAGG